MMGALTSTVFLALCPAMGNAFVFRGPKLTPPDSAGKGQASASLGASLGVGDSRLGADGALSPVSRVGRNDAGGYAAWCGRSSYPLHAFKGVEPGIIEGGNATVPIFRGVGGEEGEDWGVAAVPQDDGAVVQHRPTVKTEELSSHKPLLGEQLSSATAAHDSISTQGVDEGRHHDGTGSTQAPVMTLEEKVNEALAAMIHDALSGRPASTVALDDSVNDAIGSMLHGAFSGRAASVAFSSLLAGGGASEDGGGGRALEPTISEISSETNTHDDDDDYDSRLVVAYDDDFARAADVDWTKVFDRNAGNEVPVIRKAGKGRRQWLKRIWGRVRRKGR